MNAASIARNSAPSASASGVAFGNLIDLARVQTGDANGEICEACSTINLGSARFCKGCAHKLPAYYSTMDADETAPQHEELREAPTRFWASALTALWMAALAIAAVVVMDE